MDEKRQDAIRKIQEAITAIKALHPQFTVPNMPSPLAPQTSRDAEALRMAEGAAGWLRELK